MNINYHTEFLSQPLLDAERSIANVMQESERQVKKKCGDDEICFIGEWERIRTQLVAEGKLPEVPWDMIIEHIDHAVKVAGVDHVGLGSDFDGAWMPKGMEDVSKIPKITEALIRKGYSDSAIMKILGGNILRVMQDVDQVAKALRR